MRFICFSNIPASLHFGPIPVQFRCLLMKHTAGTAQPEPMRLLGRPRASAPSMRHLHVNVCLLRCLGSTFAGLPASAGSCSPSRLQRGYARVARDAGVPAGVQRPGLGPGEAVALGAGLAVDRQLFLRVIFAGYCTALNLKLCRVSWLALGFWGVRPDSPMTFASLIPPRPRPRAAR